MKKQRILNFALSAVAPVIFGGMCLLFTISLCR